MVKKKLINEISFPSVSNAAAGKPNHGEWYAGGSKMVAEAADEINMTGKRALVIGSQNPWLEAVLLAK